MNPLLMPLVLLHKRRAGSNMKLLPEASGPTFGVVGDHSRPAVRLSVVGESTAAGCGVASHSEGFAAALARELATSLKRPVEWNAVGQHGATARRIRYKLLPRMDKALDHAVLLAGANDVLAGRTPEEWGEDLAAIVDDLVLRAGAVTVVGIPPFQEFPSLPRILRRYLAEQATLLDQVAQRVCAAVPSATWVTSSALPEDPADFFATDGFHPSAAGYRDWAKAVSRDMNGIGARA
jgi:lysophospholipase L1-like esterase